MVYQRKIILTESEKNEIRKKYDLPQEKRDYIFEGCITVDGRFLIFHDEVFDLKEQKSLGNVWGSFDIFKTIFSNIELEDKEYTVIRENILSLPIVEGKNDLYEIRDILLEFNFFDDTWLGNKLKSAGQSIKDATVAGWEGLKKLGVSISQGQWSEILSLLGRGVLWVLRKLKEALYSTVGMIVDAILVATGVGKTVQWIPWALVTALDIYQLTNNDWPAEEKNDPMWLKLLFIGFDILGLVTTGAVAKAARAQGKALSSIAKNPKLVADFFRKNPSFKNTVQSILNGIKKVPQFLSGAQKTMSSKFPKGASFISNIMGKLSGVLKNMELSLSKLIGQTSAKGTMVGTKTGSLLYGFEKGVDKYSQMKSGLSPIQVSNLQTMDDIIKTKYGGKDPFDF